MFTGPAIDDLETFGMLPSELKTFLERCNGYVALHGGLHFRGACLSPTWHSLRHWWSGPGSLHRLFAELLPTDVPFAEDALGDQYVLRGEAVHRLAAETGELQRFAHNLRDFDAGVQGDPIRYLSLGPLQEFRERGGELKPGQLLSVMPPFVFGSASEDYSYRAVPAEERIRFLADLARQIRNLPDGTRVVLEVNQ